MFFLMKLGVFGNLMSVPIAVRRSRLPIGPSRLLLGVLGYGLSVPDYLLILDLDDGSGQREARRGSWLMARGQPGPGDPEARGAGPGPKARLWVHRAGLAPGHEP